MGKTIICRCEDVTLEEVRDAIAAGYSDIESLKRYLAVGTGPCQAKTCVVALIKVLIEEGRLDPSDAAPIAARQPIYMTELKYFAGSEEGES